MRYLKKLIAILPTAIVICFIVSLFGLKLGDIAFERDRLSVANTWYTIGNIFNPLDSNIHIRLIAVDAMIAERKEENEESTNPKITTILPKNQYVLGTTTQVPVLMYHYIRVNPWPTDTVGFGLSVTPYDFAAQLDWLKAHHYTTISLDELGANLLYGTPLPSKPIVLTFDDGYEDFYHSAYPELKKRNMKGLDFIITGFVGLPPYLTWKQIDEMGKSDIITFGAHTVHHLALTYVSDTQVLQELIQSKKDLENHLHIPVNWFAYPFGDVNERVAALTKQVGYVGAFGTKLGTAQSTDTLFTQPRVRIAGGMGVNGFAHVLPWN